MTKRVYFCALMILLGATAGGLRGEIFGTVRGIVHDPQHRPIPDARVELKSATSSFSLTTQTNQDGEFTFNPVPLGEYEVTVSKDGFATAQQSVSLASGTSPILHFPLNIASVGQTATVTAQPENLSADNMTSMSLVDRTEIARTPGADQANSLAMITDYVPAAYMTHDMLHIRGGHQVTWLVDGVPIPNANIASSLGPQIDPRDVDYLETQRGSYDAEYGDRTYGIFNVVPRTGFERDDEAELVTTAGNFFQTDDQLNFGSHTNRFAYYASVNGNRSDLGLETPVGPDLHDADNGFGGFASFIFNADPKDQLRLVTQLRRDYYQVPNTTDQEAACTSEADTCDVRDAENETDGFVNFTWVRTFNANTVLTVSPFYHHNSSNYGSSPNDFPNATTDDASTNYAGGQVTLSAIAARNNIEGGVYAYGEHENQLFGVIFNDESSPNFSERDQATGDVDAVFLNDKFSVTSWLTLIGGVRQTHSSGGVTENATSPRFGVVLKAPKLNWVFRAFYGHYYQEPPLLSISGPLIAFATSQDLGFIPLRGERDEEHQFGVTIPFRGWDLDADTFQTRAKNFFDHNNIGNSNIFIPITVDGALIQSWELTLRSPRIWNRGAFHLAYSNQIAQGRGAITGGLTAFSPPSGYFPLDHDQRNTLNAGFEANLPWKAYASTNVSYGSGFVNGDAEGIAYLPQHTTFDVSLGKDFGEDLTISGTVLNVANRHLLIDNSLTFGGTHYNNPGEMYLEVRYRFHWNH
ncbi:MAG: TonB-dependent receptor [Candidatus Acidiferrales bacterium]